MGTENNNIFRHIQNAVIYSWAGCKAAWNNELARYPGKTWLEVPWYWAEVYFYRRLLEAVGYFQPGAWQAHDPFGVQKREQAGMAVERLAGPENVIFEVVRLKQGPVFAASCWSLYESGAKLGKQPAD